MKEVQPNPVRPGRGFLGRRGWVWTAIAGWFVPVVMTCAYIALALLADTDWTGWAWMSIGLLFVMCLWWMFRELTQTAALSRAAAVGDAEAVMEIADGALAQRLVVGRADLVLYQAIAHELRGEWRSAIDAVERAQVDAGAGKKRRVLAASVKITALVESGATPDARAVLDRDLAPVQLILNDRLDAQLVIMAQLAQARVLVAERSTDARAILERVIADVRAGASTRDRAKALLARC